MSPFDSKSPSTDDNDIRKGKPQSRTSNINEKGFNIRRYGNSMGPSKSLVRDILWNSSCFGLDFIMDHKSKRYKDETVLSKDRLEVCTRKLVVKVRSFRDTIHIQTLFGCWFLSPQRYLLHLMSLGQIWVQKSR